MSCCDYAKRGGNCNSSLRVLVSNRNFIPQDYPIYNEVFTRMWQYPSSSYDYMSNIGRIHSPEEIKVEPFVLNSRGGCTTCKK